MSEYNFSVVVDYLLTKDKRESELIAHRKKLQEEKKCVLRLEEVTE